jgi:hypothetical protein
MGYVGTSIQDRWALVVDSGRSKLVKTPKLSLSYVLSTRKMSIELGTVNSDKVHIRYRFRGAGYEYFSSIENTLNHKEIKEEIMEFIPFNHFNLNDFSFSKPSKDSAYIDLDINLETSMQVKKYGNDKFLTIPNTGFLDFEKPGKRKFPVWISYPINRVDTFNYKLPYNSTLSTYPENIKIESRFGHFSLNYFAEDKLISIVRHTVLFPGKYELEEYQDFYTFIQQIKKAEDKNVIILN